MTHVVLFSGGIGSWEAAKRIAAKHGTSDLILLFTDTLIEDPDLYRFLHEAAENVGGTLVKIAEGRTPWQVFFDEGLMGNSQKDPCSRILKREMSKRWIEANFRPDQVLRHVGIDWTEEHRYTRMAERAGEWLVTAPLCEAPYLTKERVKAHAKAEGLRVPRLYDLGFDHNNCGGMCVKMGQAHAAHALNVIPEVYADWEANERRFIQLTGKNVSILKDRRGGATKPLTLESFRLRLEAGEGYDKFEWGACACFAGTEEAG